jgi:hypothetical protein
VHQSRERAFGQVTLDSFNPPMLSIPAPRTTSRSLREIQTMNETNLNRVGG